MRLLPALPLARIPWSLGCLGLLACAEESPPGLPPVLATAVVLDVVSAVQRGEATIFVQDPTWALAAWPAASLDKSESLDSLAVDEAAVVLHARAESAFEIVTPVLGPGATFVARTFVYPVDRRDPARADPFPVTFRVLLDGHERATLSSDYVRDTSREHPFDRLMRTIEVDLSASEGRAVTLRLETTRHGAPGPGPGEAAAEPAWWSLRLLEQAAVPRQRASAARPNLLVLCVDTLAAGRLSAWGYGRSTSPALDAFAATGLRFAVARSPSSWTLPATASLFTGLAPNTHGVLGDARSYLMDDLATWAEGLTAEGLLGAAFVANPLVAEANNFHQGFSHWENVDGPTPAQPADVTALTTRFLAWLDGQPADGRWFAYLHPMDPHAPYGEPGAERERFSAGRAPAADLSGHLPNRLQTGAQAPLSPEDQALVGDLYDGDVAWFDACFQALLDALAERDLRRRTVVLLTADHGEELFELGRLGHGYALNEPMLAVPLVLAGPGVPVGVVEAPVSSAALANTILALGGAPPIAGAMAALLPPPRDGGPVFSLTRTHLFGPRRVLVSARDGAGRKVVLELPEQAAEGGEPLAVECYDLRSAAGEREALALEARAADERRAFEDLVDAALVWYESTARARPGDIQPEVGIEEALHKVGYLGGEREDRRR